MNKNKPKIDSADWALATAMNVSVMVDKLENAYRNSTETSAGSEAFRLLTRAHKLLSSVTLLVLCHHWGNINPTERELFFPVLLRGIRLDIAYHWNHFGGYEGILETHLGMLLPKLPATDETVTKLRDLVNKAWGYDPVFNEKY